MNCQNAQSMVLNFINNKLDKEETKAFIEHVRDCKDCWEELEIYYVMLVGLKQLDEVAYVRFASVYRQFRDIQTFRDELNKLLSEFEPGTADGDNANR